MGGGYLSWHILLVLLFFLLLCALLPPAGFLAAARRGYSSLRCLGFSWWWPLIAEHSSRHGLLCCCGTATVEHRLNCSVAGGIFSVQGLNPRPLHWQMDSAHCTTREIQGILFLIIICCVIICFYNTSPKASPNVTGDITIFLHFLTEKAWIPLQTALWWCGFNNQQPHHLPAFRWLKQGSAGLLPLFSLSLCMFRFC